MGQATRALPSGHLAHTGTSQELVFDPLPVWRGASMLAAGECVIRGQAPWGGKV